MHVCLGGAFCSLSYIEIDSVENAALLYYKHWQVLEEYCQLWDRLRQVLYFGSSVALHRFLLKLLNKTLIWLTSVSTAPMNFLNFCKVLLFHLSQIKGHCFQSFSKNCLHVLTDYVIGQHFQTYFVHQTSQLFSHSLAPSTWVLIAWSSWLSCGFCVLCLTAAFHPPRRNSPWFFSIASVLVLG